MSFLILFLLETSVSVVAPLSHFGRILLFLFLFFPFLSETLVSFRAVFAFFAKAPSDGFRPFLLETFVSVRLFPSRSEAIFPFFSP